MKSFKEFITEFYFKDRTKKQQDAVDAEEILFRAMGPIDQRKAYKSFGKLGRKTSPSQVMVHKALKKNQHEWGFSAQYPGYSEQQCYWCGRSRYVYSNGSIRQR